MEDGERKADGGVVANGERLTERQRGTERDKNQSVKVLCSHAGHCGLDLRVVSLTQRLLTYGYLCVCAP